jgi:hypothetical protein
MTQADRVLSTPPINTPISSATSRRDFLTSAAGIAAGGTALALAIPPAAAVHDPVYALIETHKAMAAALDATLHEKGRIEGAGRPFDDSLADAAHDAEEAALIELIETVPPTLGGIIASMVYITESAELDYYRFSEDYLVPLLANLCEALQSLGMSGHEGGAHGQD